MAKRPQVLHGIKRRLAGEVPIAQAFFYDMLLIGTLVNIFTGLSAFAVYSLNFPDWAALTIFLSPQPYNFMLSVSVWRSARQASRWSGVARFGAVIWFPLMVII